ncbi:MAG: hypothetical protein U0401_26515 [Anaerolineae bacterium]
MIQPDSLLPVFVLLDPHHQDPASLNQVITTIESSHGQISHIFPNIAVIATVETGAVNLLRSMPLAAAVLTGPADSTSLGDSFGPAARGYGEMWNNLLAPPTMPPTQQWYRSIGAEENQDAFIAPDLPSTHNQVGISSTGSLTPGYFQTSEFMAGRVAVGIVLVESNGALDASKENWISEEKQLVFNKIVSALDWWAQREPRAKLSFVYDDHFSNPLPTQVEPITRPHSDQGYWIADAMHALGFTGSSYFTQVRNYDNWLRATYQANWAFTIFVVDSSSDSDNRFSNGYFAYAYLGGPFLVMTYGNNGYGPEYFDAVAAHEIGHIFRALDQYAGANQGCSLRSGYLNIENQNSQYGSCASNVDSIMRGQIYPFITKAIDPYAAGQIGWRDSDGDNILDPLDANLSLNITESSQNGNEIRVKGDVTINPFPSPAGTSITINQISKVQYRFRGGNWQIGYPLDGKFDSVNEDFELTVANLPVGWSLFEISAVDTAGNTSTPYTKTITVLDPIDGGLNTDLTIPVEAMSADEIPVIAGAAYHMQGKTITRVEYRLNGESWRPARPADGAFDSYYEPFTFELGSQELTAGRHLIDARAYDAEGDIEINFASQVLEITSGNSKIFLPLVVR